MASAVVQKAGLEAGAANLVHGCADIRRGQSVLVIAEDPSLGWYDAAAPQAVAAVARRAGTDVSILPAGHPAEPPSQALSDAIAAADVAIFFARIGDQDRFVDHGNGVLRVVSYARTAGALASAFGRKAHGEMVRLKSAVDRALMGVAEIEITCPLGSRLSGPGPSDGFDQDDVAVRRFPLSVPTPVSAAAFSGEVALLGHLTPTGSRVYEPPCIAIPQPVVAEVRHGRIAGFRGDAATVRRIEEHYALVSARFGIEADIVHSWHAGIHADCAFDGEADEDPDLWSNTIFGSPGYLHFHTCGDFPPGEICWMVAAPTIVADGRALWRDGALNLT